jgi:hypothetical protein
MTTGRLPDTLAPAPCPGADAPDCPGADASANDASFAETMAQLNPPPPRDREPSPAPAVTAADNQPVVRPPGAAPIPVMEASRKGCLNVEPVGADMNRAAVQPELTDPGWQPSPAASETGLVRAQAMEDWCDPATCERLDESEKADHDAGETGSEPSPPAAAAGHPLVNLPWPVEPWQVPLSVMGEGGRSGGRTLEMRRDSIRLPISEWAPLRAISGQPPTKAAAGEGSPATPPTAGFDLKAQTDGAPAAELPLRAVSVSGSGMETPGPSCPAGSASAGMDAAKYETKMKTAAKAIKAARFTEQILPGGDAAGRLGDEVFGDVPGPGDLIRAALDDDAPGQRPFLESPHDFTLLREAARPGPAYFSPSPRAPGAATIELLHGQIAGEAAELRRLGADSVALLVRPDDGTEVLLHLKVREGLVEVRAQVERGDPGALAGRWAELQQALSAQGIRLARLEEPVTTPSRAPAEASHTEGPASQTDRDRDGQHGQRRAPESMDDLPLVGSPTESPRSRRRSGAYAGTSSILWESWG